MAVTADTSTDLDEGELGSEVRRAWASLIERSDAIADDITLTLLDQHKSFYDEAGPKVRADLRVSTREHIRRGIQTMAGLVSPGQEAVHVWRETGRRRARQGVPMELVLSAYTLGTRVLWESLLNQRGSPEVDIDDQVLVIAGRQVWSALDVQNAVMIEAYRRESAQMQRRDLQRQGLVLDALVDGRGSDPAFAAEAKQTLGLEPDEPVACVVAPFDATLENPLRAPEDRLEGVGVASYWHVRGDTYFGLAQLGGHGLHEVRDALRPVTAGRVGIAAAPEGLPGFSTAYQLARGTAETFPRGAAEVACVDDRLPEVLLADSPTVATLLTRSTLGPVLALPEEQAGVLLDTLRALLAHHGSPTHAASELYCHRNTVIYRMRQLRELTGRDLGDPRDRLLYSLALLALDS